jgi:hypothetical protein
LEWAKSERSDVDIICVVANVMYETWFVAAAQSLGESLNLSADTAVPDDPEQQRQGKGWIERYFKGPKYSETQDQPAMTAKMDLVARRAKSPSFDKLCRELSLRCKTL